MATSRINGAHTHTVPDGTRIFYTTQGNPSGIPFLLIHGWTCDQTDWAFQVPMLIATNKLWVIAMDVRAHGRSSLPPNVNPDDVEGELATALDTIHLAEDAASLLRRLGIDPEGDDKDKALVMGHSMGGNIVNELVRLHPGLFRGYVSVDAAFYGSSEMREQSLIALGSAAGPAKDFHVKLSGMLRYAYTQDVPSWIPAWHEMRQWGHDARPMYAALVGLSRVIGPGGATYLKGSKTRGLPRLCFVSSLANKAIEEEVGVDGEWERLEIVEVGHWVMQPPGAERFNEVLEEWLKGWGWL